MDAAVAIGAMHAAAAADADAVERVLAHLGASGALTAESLARARAAAAHGAEPIALVLPRLGLVSERDLAAAFAAVLGLACAGADDFPDEPVLPGRLGARFLRHTAALPLSVQDGRVLLAMADPLDAATCQAVSVATGLDVERRAAARSEIEAAIDRLYAPTATGAANRSGN